MHGIASIIISKVFSSFSEKMLFFRIDFSSSSTVLSLLDVDY